MCCEQWNVEIIVHCTSWSCKCRWILKWLYTLRLTTSSVNAVEAVWWRFLFLREWWMWCVENKGAKMNKTKEKRKHTWVSFLVINLCWMRVKQTWLTEHRTKHNPNKTWNYVEIRRPQSWDLPSNPGTEYWDSPKSMPVHSLMMSSHLFLCLPRLLPPCIVPCKMFLAKPDECLAVYWDQNKTLFHKSHAV